ARQNAGLVADKRDQLRYGYDVAVRETTVEQRLKVAGHAIDGVGREQVGIGEQQLFALAKRAFAGIALDGGDLFGADAAGDKALAVVGSELGAGRKQGRTQCDLLALDGAESADLVGVK